MIDYLFSQSRMSREWLLRESCAPIATFRAFRRSSEIFELCRKVADATCSLWRVDFGLWEIYRINLTELIFSIKTQFLLTKKKFDKKFVIQSNTCFCVDTKNKHSCRRNRICMHVMLLQILQYLSKTTGYFLYFFY